MLTRRPRKPPGGLSHEHDRIGLNTRPEDEALASQRDFPLEPLVES